MYVDITGETDSRRLYVSDYRGVLDQTSVQVHSVDLCQCSIKVQSIRMSSGVRVGFVEIPISPCCLY